MQKNKSFTQKQFAEQPTFMTLEGATIVISYNLTHLDQFREE
jgi:hypothetical protein